MGLQINIDNGGTLTDICVMSDAGVRKTKVLTTPYDLSKCFFDGLKKASAAVYGEADVKRLLEEVDLIRYSTTQGTNAICERKGPKLGLIMGANDAALPTQLEAHDPEVYRALVGDRCEWVDLANLEGAAAEMAIVKAINKLTAVGANRLVVSFSGVGAAKLEERFKKVALRKYPRHLLGAVPILYGSDLSSDADMARRTWTSLLNSFLHPAMETFLFNAENRLREYRTKNPLLIFRNDGDASRVAKTTALKTYSSGPRGGMEGVKTFSKLYGYNDVVSIDVGGTTTDIGQYLDGSVAEVRRGRVEGISVSFPLTEIVSAGAGGSSIFRVIDGQITIGPDSVGAVPGPACFGRGGKEATITDACVLSGLFDPKSYFGGDMSLDAERATAAIKASIADPLGISLDGALQRMERSYEEKIAAELHRVTKISKDTVLLAFGGAGPLNACGVAEKAGISTVVVPSMAAVFSAYGIGACNISQRYTQTVDKPGAEAIASALADLKAKAGRDMYAEGVEDGDYVIETRLVGEMGDGRETFHPFVAGDQVPAELAAAKSVELELTATKSLRADSDRRASFVPAAKAVATGQRNILVAGKGRIDVPVYRLAELKVGAHAAGPAIVEEDYFTCCVLAGWSFVISDAGDIQITKKG